jgi:hypothetical protein
MGTFSHYASDGTMNMDREEELFSNIDFGRRHVRIALESLSVKGLERSDEKRQTGEQQDSKCSVRYEEAVLSRSLCIKPDT